MRNSKSSPGFTLVEILVVIAVIGILSAIAMPMYADYIARARAADILVKYDAARSNARATLGGGAFDDCGDVVRKLNAPEGDPYARLSYQFQAMDSGGGYRLVLGICSRAGSQGATGVKVANSAHELLQRLNSVEKGSVVTATAVSFAAPLTDPSRATCSVAYLPPITACGDVMAQVMKFAGPNTYVRPAGGILNTGGPLSAFSLDMSFIGDGSTPAGSGGQGPVMFNYGDGTNGHNAISLWNPKSLTIAVMGRDYDTHINVADGQTHRLTTTWDKNTGQLTVYDNGRQVSQFSDVSKGVDIPGGGSMVVAHKDNSGSYSPNEAFNGQVFHAAIANAAVSAEQAKNPLRQVLDKTNGLLADFRAQGGQFVDTTGRHQVESGGVTAHVTAVDAALAKP